MVSLVSGWFPPATVAVAVSSLVACVPWERRVRWRVLGVALCAASTATTALVVTVHVLGWSPWPLPWTFDVMAGAVLLAAALGVAGWRFLRWRRVMPAVALVTSTVMAATLVNATYQYFPTWDSLVGPPPGQTSVASVQVDRQRHRALLTGAVVPVHIPAPRSHFAARTAYVWVPPAYTADPSVSLPVVELLAGSPGTPLDWIRSGGAEVTADAYAGLHRGVAPLLVMPDDNGSLTADTECVDGPAGAAETYLTVDVPAFMRAAFHAARGPRSLAVAGLSEGGTCAVMLALRHRSEYAAFGDYSGLAAPTSADVVAPVLTTRTLFGGSVVRYDEHDPPLLLRDMRRERRAHDPAGWFEVGGADPGALTAQTVLTGLARSAGVDTVAVVVPGEGHSFALWRAAFRQSLPFFGRVLAPDLAA